MADLKAGATIDTDPVTQQVETVESIGTSSVVIDLEMKGISSRNEFDLSAGVLIGYILKIPTSGSTCQLQLQR